jgi:hypothetical protein
LRKFTQGEIIERLLYKDPATQEPIKNYEDINFYKLQHRVVLGNCGHIDPENIDEYLQKDGYEG